jgi:16S rRNA (adenine1518-N6/adenine1519-N6)-dimethyltransferase
MSLETLPTLREALDAGGLLAKKSFGQHFLLDLNITRKIVRQAGDLAGQAVIEVGPGPGGLTRALLESNAAHVIAVEKDERFAQHLQPLADAAEGRLTVILGDALKVDEQALIDAHAPGLACQIIANLPYNVGTALLIKWLTGALQPAAMHLMFQKEVAMRIAAPVNDAAYGRLSVLAQAVTSPRIAMTLPAKAFTPPPKVESAVVSLFPLPDRPPIELLQALQKVTAAAFGQRRKKLRSSLKALGGEDLCLRAGVDADARAETIGVLSFLSLAKALSS